MVGFPVATPNTGTLLKWIGKEKKTEYALLSTIDRRSTGFFSLKANEIFLAQSLWSTPSWRCPSIAIRACSIAFAVKFFTVGQFVSVLSFHKYMV